MKRLLIIGSTCVDVILRLDHLPTTGEDMHPVQRFAMGGCAFNVAQVPKAYDVDLRFVTPIGDHGVFSDFVRAHLDNAGFRGPITVPDSENGCCYCLVERSGERTFLSVHGIEYSFHAEYMDAFAGERFDYTYICGLEVEETTGGELVAWLEAHPDIAGTVVYAPGPRGIEVDTDRTERILGMHPILHLNEQEALALAGMSGSEDRVLAASGGLLDAGAILSAESRGYLAFGASGTDAGAVFEGVVLCDAGSGVVDFRVAATRPREAEASWRVAEDAAGEGTALVERRDSDGKWRVVVSDLPIAALGATIPIPSGRSRYRLFDGWEFHYDDAWSFSGVQFSVVTSATPRCETPRVHWEATTQLATTNDQVYLGQGVTILARIYDSFDSTSLLLAKDDRVQEVRYSCRYVSKGLFEETLEPVPGHEDVVAPVESVLEAAQRSDAWTRDDEGYSFALTPDIREYPLFERAGKYVFKITISLKDANPVVFYVNVEAVEE